MAIALAAAAFFSLSRPARAYLPPHFGGALRVGIPGRVESFDPSLATENHEFAVVSCMFETLLAQGSGGTLVPVLLDELPATSEDGLKYYFKLKENVKFHDGTPLDSADVLHSFKVLAKKIRSPYAWILSDISGAETFRVGRSRTIDGFKITDHLRFEITLNGRNPDFLKYLSFPAASIIPTADRNFEPPVGTGPFIFFQKEPRGHITLRAHQEYRLGRPFVDSVEFTVIPDSRDRFMAFEAGDIHITRLPFAGLDIEDEKSFPGPATSIMKRLYFLDVNPAYPALRTPEARAAVSSAVDRSAIVRGYLNNTASVENNVDPGAPVAAAPSGAGGASMELWYSNRYPVIERIAEKIAYDLGEYGIEVQPRPRTERGLSQYPLDTAPAIILRSLPLLFSLDETVGMVLFSDEYQTSHSAAALRLGLIGDGASETAALPHAADVALAINLFSKRSSYLHSESVHGLEAGFYGQPRLGNVFIRGELSEVEMLDN